MATVPVQELKVNLAAWLQRVASGERVVITRRNLQIAELIPVEIHGRHRGTHFGHGRLVPLPFRVAPGTVAALLADDRADDR